MPAKGETTAYVYKWTHVLTLQWYIGIRYASGCHPEDGYICSSKTVKPRILKQPDEWTRQIIAVGSEADMKDLEEEILHLFFDADDPRCLNRNLPRAPPVMRGKNHPMFGRTATDEERAKMSTASKKRFEEDAFYEKMRSVWKTNAANRMGKPGKSPSEAARRRSSNSHKTSPKALAQIKRLHTLVRGVPIVSRYKPVVGTSVKDPSKHLHLISVNGLLDNADRHGFDATNIISCCQGKRKSHKGWTWRYATNDEIKENFPEHEGQILSRN